MDEHHHPAPQEVAPAEKFKLVLRPTAPLPFGAAEALLDLVLSAIPRGPTFTKAKYCRVEFPDEVVEEIIEDVRKIAAETEPIERQLQNNPPSLDEREAAIRNAAEAVRAAVEDMCASGIRPRGRVEPLHVVE